MRFFSLSFPPSYHYIMHIGQLVAVPATTAAPVRPVAFVLLAARAMVPLRFREDNRRVSSGVLLQPFLRATKSKMLKNNRNRRSYMHTVVTQKDTRTYYAANAFSKYLRVRVWVCEADERACE